MTGYAVVSSARLRLLTRESA